jgi:hypothetical protein
VKPSEAPTVKAKRSPLILLVGLSASFVRRCNDAAIKVQATVVAVEAGAESTFAMQTLPIAVVMHENAVPGSPLGTIARELGIELIPLASEDLPDAELEALIHQAVAAARTRWRMTRP